MENDGFPYQLPCVAARLANKHLVKTHSFQHPLAGIDVVEGWDASIQQIAAAAVDRSESPPRLKPSGNGFQIFELICLYKYRTEIR